LLLRFVRNVFLHDYVMEGESWYLYHENEAAICFMINVLELFGTYSDRTVVERRAIKEVRKLNGDNRRDVVKFAAKRLPCACLKDLHRAARKKVAKMGKRFCCAKQFPRSQCTPARVACWLNTVLGSAKGPIGRTTRKAV